MTAESSKQRCSAMTPVYGAKGNMRQCSNYALPQGEFCASHDPVVKQKKKLALTTPEYWAKKSVGHKKVMLRMVALGDDYSLQSEREK